MDVPEHSMIDGDIECNGCRYNLRGLSRLGNCPECGSPIAKSIAVHKKTFSSRFRRVRPNRLRMLLIAHVAVGLVYLGLFVVPHAIQNEPWAAAYNVRLLTKVSQLLIFPGLPMAAVLGITTLILAIANRDRMSAQQFRRFMILCLAASVPQVISFVNWRNYLM